MVRDVTTDFTHGSWREVLLNSSDVDIKEKEKIVSD